MVLWRWHFGPAHRGDAESPRDPWKPEDSPGQDDFRGPQRNIQTGSGTPDDPEQVALARIRQLAAHEVGHTLGFAHNFAASTNNRASVMDYPAPDIRVSPDNTLDFSNAYAVGLGPWDRFAVKWLYSQFPPGASEPDILNRFVDEAQQQGLRFVSDGHARPVGSAHRYGAIWDNGADPIAALNETMAVRRIALANFDLQVLGDGSDRATLRQVLVPIYLYHRYQVAAASKLIGGYDYAYSVVGDGFGFVTPVPPTDQRRAIAALLATLDVNELMIPDRLLTRLGPAPTGFGFDPTDRETFASDLHEIFDPLSAAESAGAIVFDALLAPARAARLIETNRRNGNSPGFEELLAALRIELFKPQARPETRLIARRLQTRFVLDLIDLGRDPSASPEVHAETDAFLEALQTNLSRGLAADNSDPQSNHRAWLLSVISAHLNRDDKAVHVLQTGPRIPPGSPIGSDSSTRFETCWHCDPILVP